MPTRSNNGRSPLLVLRIHGRIHLKQLRKAKNGIQWGSQLMADSREQLRLVVIRGLGGLGLDSNLFHVMAQSGFVNRSTKSFDLAYLPPNHFSARFEPSGLPICPHVLNLQRVLLPSSDGCRNGGLQPLPALCLVQAGVLGKRWRRARWIATEDSIQFIGPDGDVRRDFPFPAPDSTEPLRLDKCGFAFAKLFDGDVTLRSLRAQGRLRLLHFRDVSDVRDEPQDLTIDDVRNVCRKAVPLHPGGTGNNPLEQLLHSIQGPADIRLVECEKAGAQQVLDRRADKAVWVDTEPALVGVIRKSASKVAIPIGQHRGNVIHQESNVIRRIPPEAAVHVPPAE